jgi:protein tyrosine phosphatase domain-containing protein 1
MLDIIKEMTHTIKHDKKKVFVHCHAGYGRTGIVLACYKVYNDNMTVDEAVRSIRASRPKCIEQKSQMKYCIKFYQCM